MTHRQLPGHYQPITDAGGHVHAVEAPLRRQDPQHGSLVAARFIDVAVDTGLIVLSGASADRQVSASRTRTGRCGVPDSVTQVSGGGEFAGDVAQFAVGVLTDAGAQRERLIGVEPEPLRGMSSAWPMMSRLRKAVFGGQVLRAEAGAVPEPVVVGVVRLSSFQRVATRSSTG